MDLDTINKIEKLQTEYNTLITELKKDKIQLEKLKRKLEPVERKYLSLQEESDDLEEILEIERMETQENVFIKSQNNKIFKKTITISSLPLSIITLIVSLIFTKSIIILSMITTSSFFIGALIGFLIHKKKEKTYKNKLRIQFKEKPEYKEYQKQREKFQQQRIKKNEKRNEISICYHELKKEYNNLHAQINYKIEHIDDFRKKAVLELFSEEFEKIKDEIHPGKLLMPNQQNINPKKKELKK